MTENIAVGGEFDPVTRPAHYNSHPSGVEVKHIRAEMGCSFLSDAVKYICRYQHKGNPVQDLEKAQTYIGFERVRRLDPRRGYVSPFESGPPVYRPEFAPFYLYVAAEPDPFVRELLIDIWNADKMDGDKVLELLNSAHTRLGTRADMLRRQLAWEEASKEISEQATHERSEHAESLKAKLDAAIERQRDEERAAHEQLEQIQRPERVEVIDRASKLLAHITDGDEIWFDPMTGEDAPHWSGINVVLREGGRWIVEHEYGSTEIHGNKKIRVRMDKTRWP